MSAGSHRKIIEVKAAGTGGRYTSLDFFNSTVDIDRIISVREQAMEGEHFYALKLDTGNTIWAKMDEQGKALVSDLLGAEHE